MKPARIPLELCELIIDSIRESPPWPRRLVGSVHDAQGELLLSFRACAIVCSAWLPRARYNLYYRISFRLPSQVELLIRSLDENPSLAAMVRELVLSPGVYIPFAHATLVRRLRHLRTLVYELPASNTASGNWPYPPHYHRLVAQFPLTVLAIRYSYGPLATTAWFEMFRLIWTLRNLESLHLELYHIPDLTDLEVQRLAATRRPGACAQLKTLVIDGNTMRRCTNCLPVGAFGASTERLSLTWRDGRIPTTVLAHVKKMSELQEIYVDERCGPHSRRNRSPTCEHRCHTIVHRPTGLFTTQTDPPHTGLSHDAPLAARGQLLVPGRPARPVPLPDATLLRRRAALICILHESGVVAAFDGLRYLDEEEIPLRVGHALPPRVVTIASRLVVGTA
ncbi:hypothetical protein OH76DRAFT_1485821 [Lentinus brumalis]|uniref:Uncharacterized protein n=1 Tax=Lentinus brumalis TaxID=2498619 RepID=A0A371D0H4_9APHY|nr:hypothetical protein OH76DRAFT_1485821 [Polyporus brumalis]